MLSHELRTPLQSILGWIGLLRRTPSEPGRLEHGLAVIERNVRTQTRLIGDLLDVSRIVVGTLQIERRAVDLAAVIRAALDSLRHEVQAKDLKIETRLNRLIGRVLGDPVRLEQVVANLVSNAVKFTPQGGRISVHLERGDGVARIAVTDTGQGIEPVLLAQIFERFRQADSTTRRAQGGLGLGLTIVRHLIESHGGVVHVTSAGTGQGSTFTVELPLTLMAEGVGAEGASEPQAEPPIAEQASLEGISVLVVDDDRDTLEVVTTALRQEGADVHEAASVSAALELLQKYSFDVLLSDIAMPGADGYDLMRALRAMMRTGPSPVAIALTGFAAGQDQERAHAAGFDIYVPKPVDGAQLRAIIHQALDRRRPSSSTSESR
jgi:CheY-like chemotaxis protein/two-component sensor histidine kinase